MIGLVFLRQLFLVRTKRIRRVVLDEEVLMDVVVDVAALLPGMYLRGFQSPPR
jgi:hypothetical protein